jgi:hypothetical protein
MFSCNLNQYRNAHYRILNDAKKNYASFIYDMDLRERLENPVAIIYSIYAPNKRMYDVMNVGSITDKFACDALVNSKVLIDDNYNYVRYVACQHKGIDRDNPRAVLRIYDYSQAKQALSLFRTLQQLQDDT